MKTYYYIADLHAVASRSGNTCCLYDKEHGWTKVHACIVKALDRCNNVATMASSFSRKKLIEGVDETEQYAYPLLDHIKHEYMEYRDVIFVIKYQLLSTIETIKALLIS